MSTEPMSLFLHNSPRGPTGRMMDRHKGGWKDTPVSRYA